MSNLVTDASFETGSVAWVKQSGATIEEPGDAHTGTKILRSLNVHPLFGGDVAGSFGQQIAVPPGQEITAHNLRFYARVPVAPGNDLGWKVAIYSGYKNPVGPTGLPLYEQFFEARTMSADWTQYSIEGFTPGVNEITLSFLMRYVGAGAPIYSFVTDFDTVTLLTTAEEVDLVKRREIKEAYIAAIGAITTGGGYSHTIVDAIDGIRPSRLLTGHPSVMVTYGEERKETAELQRRRGHLDLDTFIVCKETALLNAEQVCDEVCGDIQAAIEPQTGGQWLGLTYIDNIMVRDITPVEPAEEAHRGTRVWVLTTRVDYRHDIGAP